jgi:hypothetical protein
MPEPVFLNIRNPTEKPIARGDGAAAREQLIKEGYDGTIEAEDGMETEYAAGGEPSRDVRPCPWDIRLA